MLTRETVYRIRGVALFVCPIVHADFPAIALANISRDDIAFFEKHRLGGMHFLHHATFRDRTDTVADCVHVIKLAGVAVGMGFEQNFVSILDLLLARSRGFIRPGLNCTRREEVCDRFRVVLIKRLAKLPKRNGWRTSRTRNAPGL